MKVILIALATVILCVVLMLLYVNEQKKKREYERKNGIKIFGYRMNDKDFFSFCNTLVAYLICYREIDLKKFLNTDYLRVTIRDVDFHTIENIINLYPCIACKYVGNYKFKLDEDAIAKKCEKYQKETGNDDYMIPLFEIGLIQRNENFFNLQTRYQQVINMKSIMNHEIHGYQFNNQEQTQREIDKVERNVVVKSKPVYKMQKRESNDQQKNMVVKRVRI